MKTLATMVIASILATGMAVGADKMEPSVPAGVAPMALRGTVLLDKTVEGRDETADVDDLVLSTARDRIEFFVVALADRRILIPYAKAKHDADVLRVDKAFSTFTPVADREWPHMYEGRLVSSLLGYGVRDDTGEEVASIHDILIERDGRVAEATLSVGGVIGIGAKLASVDWKTLSFSEEGGFAEVSMGRNEIESLAYREGEYWQRLGFGEEKTREPGVEERHRELEPMPPEITPWEMDQPRTY
jgi:hypothetical protein